MSSLSNDVRVLQTAKFGLVCHFSTGVKLLRQTCCWNWEPLWLTVCETNLVPSLWDSPGDQLTSAWAWRLKTRTWCCRTGCAQGIWWAWRLNDSNLMVYIWLSTGYLVVLEIEELELDGAELFVYRLPGGPRLNDSNLMVYTVYLVVWGVPGGPGDWRTRTWWCRAVRLRVTLWA